MWEPGTNQSEEEIRLYKNVYFRDYNCPSYRAYFAGFWKSVVRGNQNYEASEQEKDSFLKKCCFGKTEGSEPLCYHLILLRLFACSLVISSTFGGNDRDWMQDPRRANFWMTFFTLFQKISTAGSSARWYKKTHFPQIPLKFLEIYEWILRKHFFCDFPKKVNMHSGVMVWMRFSWKCCTWTFSCQRSFTFFQVFQFRNMP